MYFHAKVNFHFLLHFLSVMLSVCVEENVFVDNLALSYLLRHAFMKMSEHKVSCYGAEQNEHKSTQHITRLELSAMLFKHKLLYLQSAPWQPRQFKENISTTLMCLKKRRGKDIWAFMGLWDGFICMICRFTARVVFQTLEEIRSGFSV